MIRAEPWITSTNAFSGHYSTSDLDNLTLILPLSLSVSIAPATSSYIYIDVYAIVNEREKDEVERNDHIILVFFLLLAQDLYPMII